MSDEDLPPVTNITVTGGSAGAEAAMDDLLTLAGLHRTLAGDLQGLASQVAGIAGDGDLTAAMLLDPVGVAVVRGMLDDALVGRTGLHTLADQLAEHAQQVQSVHDYTAHGDAVQASIMDGVDWWAGRSGLTIPGAVADYLARSTYEEFTGGPGFSLGTEWILAHPGYLDTWGPTLPGLLGMPPWMDYQDTAGLIAGFWPDGQPKVGKGKVSDPTTIATHAPVGLGDLMTNLSGRNSENTKTNDVVDVQRITQPDGSVAFIVNIPGTKELNPGWPGTFNTHANDMVTNLYGVAGEQTAREEAIAEALRLAGASSTDPVMLVGHSQGGILAAQAAADSADGTFDFNVTHVVTAASPIALADVPSGVQVLALEGNNDPIPQSDAGPNPESANVTTVHFDYDTHDMGGNHALEDSYQEVADTLDEQLATPATGPFASLGAGSGGSAASPSVTSFVDSASAFLDDGTGATEIRTEVFEIERVP